MATAEQTPPPSTTVTPPSIKPTSLPLSSPITTTPYAAASTSSSSPVTPSVATPSDADLVHIPSYSRWFSWDEIHECEVRFLPEFFDSRSPSKTPRIYLYLRNSIIKQFRRNPSSKITFTDVRKTLVADVGSIRRVFDFLDTWGLINYSPSALTKPLKWDEKDSKSALHGALDSNRPGSSTSDAAPLAKETSKRVCSSCKSVCTIACFTCDRYDFNLCARCFVRGNYRVGLSSSDFRRVELSEETAKADWTDKETLQLLEAVMHYGDDWKKVAQYVSSRSEKECITHFIKLPMGEQFASSPDVGAVINKQNRLRDDINAGSGIEHSPSKRLCLTPLADASNPIMAQAAFLSALAGTRVAEAAARAAVNAVSEADFKSLSKRIQDGSSTHDGNTVLKSSEEANSDINPTQEKKPNVDEELYRVVEVQMKEILEKIIEFEEKDLQIEKEWQQMEQLRNALFSDQLNYLCPKTSTRRSGGEQGIAGEGFT